MVACVVCQVKQRALPVCVINITGGELLLKSVQKGTSHTAIVIENEGEGTGCGEPERPNQSYSVESLLSLFGIGRKGLNPTDVAAESKLLTRRINVFSTGDSDLGRTHLALHQINTDNVKPVKYPLGGLHCIYSRRRRNT